MRMRHPGFAFFVVLLTALLTSGPTMMAQPTQAKHARVELLSRQRVVTPGRDLLLGVHFTLDTGWHIYWINPGDSGQPPVLEWQLPSGFIAREVQWPRPERLKSSSRVADYGYQDELLLLVPVRVPAAVSGGARVDLALRAKWLICREVCLPDHAQLHLSLPAAAPQADDPVNAPLFAAAQKLLPKPLPSGWKATAESRKDEFVLSVLAGKPLAKAEFFPLEPAQVDNAAPQKIEPAANGLRIILKKSDLLLKPVAVLSGVIVLPGGNAYHVEARVTSGKVIK